MCSRKGNGRAVTTRRTDVRGFTLIEVMIVVGILAIVAVLAIPAYTNYIVRTNRAEAQVELLNAASALERCFSRFSAYNNANCAAATQLAGAGFTSENGIYIVRFAATPARTATTYTLEAVPQGAQATRDSECATFTLNHTGQRGVSNAATPVDRCWRR